MARRILFMIFMISFVIRPLQAEGGSLAGSAAFVYSDYESEYDNNRIKASAFEQTYDLAYSTGGVLANGHAGRYSLMVGGSILVFDSEINSTESSDSATKLIYSGNILIAPGGLPFRFNAYARDASTASTGYRQVSLNGLSSDRSVPWEVSSAQSRLIGFTFLAGIQNGRYRGVYRDMLSMFPRLLIDYEEEIKEDKESETPTHTRDRNLAFVSLNKKKNWFHYRFHDYTNFLDPIDDYSNKEVILGTIDHQMRRQWISLTNWIKISVDGKMSRSEMVQFHRRGTTHYINFYSTLHRSRYRLNGSLNYFRNTSLSDVTANHSNQLTIPIYASGIIDKNTDWHISLNSSFSKRSTLSPTVSKESGKGFSIISTVNTNKLRPFQFDSHIQLSSSEEDSDEVGGGSLNSSQRDANIILQAYSNTRYQKPDSFRAALNVGATETEDCTSWRSQLSLSWNRRQASGGAIGLSQSISYATGGRGTKTSSSTAVFKTFKPTFKLNNSISAKFTASSDTETDINEGVFSADHVLKYRKSRNMAVESKTAIKISNQYGDVPNGFSVGYTRYALAKQSLQHSTKLQYEKSREFALSGSLSLLHVSQLEKGGDFTVYSLSQGMGYTWYTSNGIIRKLADLGQSLGYGRGPGAWSRSFSLSGSYFPTKILFMKSSFSCQESSNGSDGIRVYFAMGFNWPKLRVGLTYDYNDSVSWDDVETTDRVVRLTLEKVI